MARSKDGIAFLLFRRIPVRRSSVWAYWKQNCSPFLKIQRMPSLLSRRRFEVPGVAQAQSSLARTAHMKHQLALGISAR